MKISVVISVLNQFPLARTCYDTIRKNTSGDVEFIIIDNQSSTPITQEMFPEAKIVRNDKNIGVYPTFQQGFKEATGDVVAFFHSDVVIWEKNWDMGVIEAFDQIPELGLLGFVGSDEIDSNGGRGGGTMSNFQGKAFTSGGLGVDATGWRGSPAEAHGKRIDNYKRGAVVDGCVMIIRRSSWNKIGYRKYFPPHHFYDRLISTQILEAGLHVGVLGVAFDHISGQTVNQENGYQTFGKNWLVERGIFDETKPIDQQIYEMAEIQWLREYRDEKHIVPIKI